jgi:hypothetical protein
MCPVRVHRTVTNPKILDTVMIIMTDEGCFLACEDCGKVRV